MECFSWWFYWNKIPWFTLIYVVWPNGKKSPSGLSLALFLVNRSSHHKLDALRPHRDAKRQTVYVEHFPYVAFAFIQHDLQLQFWWTVCAIEGLPSKILPHRPTARFSPLKPIIEQRGLIKPSNLPHATSESLASITLTLPSRLDGMTSIKTILYSNPSAETSLHGQSELLILFVIAVCVKM